MNEIKFEVDISTVEELFINSYKTRHYDVASTMILELKDSIEIFVVNRLMRGHSVSLQQAFNHCVDDLVICEDEFEEMHLAC